MEEMDKTDKMDLEDQFILRLPNPEADLVRNLLHTKPKKIKRRLLIDMEPESGRASVIVDGKVLSSRLQKLPTITESLKTYNKSDFMKICDICHILDCTDSNNYHRNASTSVRGHEAGGEDEEEWGHVREVYPHGLTPPLKNARRKRFRRPLINKDESAVSVQKELFYLLQTDLEAVSTRFEIIKTDSVAEGRRCGDSERTEIEIFGNLLTDSEETDSNVEEVE